MPITILAVPYDSGAREARMGRGPGYLLGAGLAEALGAGGRDVAVEWVEAEVPLGAEIAAAFALGRALAPRVRDAAARGALPVVLSGNCIATLGALGGHDAARGDVGLVWLDAHGDLNTPDTTRSGFLDGMSLAAATGRSWRALAATIPGFAPLADDHVLLVGARDFDPEEGELVRRAIRCVSPAAVRDGAVRDALGALHPAVRRLHIHLDLDVLDPGEARWNGFPPAPGGLTAGEVREVIRAAASRLPIAGVTLSALDPDHDADGRARRAAIEVLGELVSG
jgi:arginase